MATEQNKEIEASEDEYWSALAKEGEESGFLGEEESDALMKKLLTLEEDPRQNPGEEEQQ